MARHEKALRAMIVASARRARVNGHVNPWNGAPGSRDVDTPANQAPPAGAGDRPQAPLFCAMRGLTPYVRARERLIALYTANGVAGMSMCSI